MMKRRSAVLVFVLGFGWGLAFAASPPLLMNYQGVLRDPAGNPISGSRDMVFALYDAAAGGNELFVDEHLTAGSGAVAVSNGVFSTAIGGGSVFDGAGPGTFASLGDVFRRLKTVYLEVRVGGETLNPRIRVVSSAYALDDTTIDPPCAVASNRFADCGNGTVTDTVTGLVWLKMVDCSAVFGASTTFAGAYQLAATLADGACGLTDESQPGDWRVPSRAEVEVLVNLATANGCAFKLPDVTGLSCCFPGPCPFSSLSTNFLYWSATGVDTTPANGWAWNLNTGAWTSLFKGVGEHVWAVRNR